MKGYVYLVLTIVVETAAVICMKLASGGQDKLYTILGSVLYFCTFVLLTAALKFLPMGYTNAIWAGSSTLLVYMVGVYYFGEKTSILEIIFIICILVGIIGLNFVAKVK